MAKKGLKSIEEITEPLSTVDTEETKEETVDVVEEVKEVGEIEEPKVEEVQQRCSDCKHFIPYRGMYKCRGYRTCSVFYKNYSIKAFYGNGKIAPFLIKEDFVPKQFPSCKYFENKIAK